MASRPITSWQIEGEKVEGVTDFIFLGSKTTADSDCSHEIKRCLLLKRKPVSNLDSTLKSTDITLLTIKDFDVLSSSALGVLSRGVMWSMSLLKGPLRLPYTRDLWHREKVQKQRNLRKSVLSSSVRSEDWGQHVVERWNGWMLNMVPRPIGGSDMRETEKILLSQIYAAHGNYFNIIVLIF